MAAGSTPNSKSARNQSGRVIDSPLGSAQCLSSLAPQPVFRCKTPASDCQPICPGRSQLVLGGGGPHASLAMYVAAALANRHDARTTIFLCRGAEWEPMW